MKPTRADDLRESLRALALVCGSCADLFRRLFEDRRTRRNSALANLNAMPGLPLSEAQKDAIVREFQQVCLPGAAGEAPSPSPLETLCVETVNSGIEVCNQCETAVRDGGAIVLDDAKPRGAVANSLAIARKVGHLRRILATLAICASDRNTLGTDGLEGLKELREWFNATKDELVAVLELPGLDAPPSHDSEPESPPAEAHESASPALTTNQSRVLQAMARFDGSLLLSAAAIAKETEDKAASPPVAALSDEAVRQYVVKLIESSLAERPEGVRSGARLTTAGRRLAGKIAD